MSHSAADSQLTATFALVMGTQAVETLANWLFDLELTTYGIDADLIEQLKHDSPRQYLALIEKSGTAVAETKSEHEKTSLRY